MRVTVIGAGVMGVGIAQTLAVAGCRVRCQDISATRLSDGAAMVEDGRYGLSRAVDRGKLSAGSAEHARRRLTFTLDLAEALDATELVVEAVPEDLVVKIRLFRRLDSLAPKAAILATNSSGLPVGALAAAVDRPAQVIGWHWSSPAQVMPMAEVVVTALTSEGTRDAVVALARRCGKNPVIVNDRPTAWGYAGNRVFAAALREARAIVAEGAATPEAIDTIMRDGWGWPAGPFAVVEGASNGWGDDRASGVGAIL